MAIRKKAKRPLTSESLCVGLFFLKSRVSTTGQIRGARGSRPFKLVNEIMSLTKVGIYALGVTKIH